MVAVQEDLYHMPMSGECEHSTGKSRGFSLGPVPKILPFSQKTARKNSNNFQYSMKIASLNDTACLISSGKQWYAHWGPKYRVSRKLSLIAAKERSNIL
jgi:hypothetical protein